jgi:hypothetical protein
VPVKIKKLKNNRNFMKDRTVHDIFSKNEISFESIESSSEEEEPGAAGEEDKKSNENQMEIIKEIKNIDD